MEKTALTDQHMGLASPYEDPNQSRTLTPKWELDDRSMQLKPPTISMFVLMLDQKVNQGMFFGHFCEVCGQAIIHKRNEPNLATGNLFKYGDFRIFYPQNVAILASFFFLQKYPLYPSHWIFFLK